MWKNRVEAFRLSFTDIFNRRDDMAKGRTINLICTLFTALAGLVLIILGIRKRDDEDDEDSEQTENHRIRRALAIAPAAVALLLFALTQDLSLKMALIDSWTLWFLVVTLIQVAIMVVSRKETEDEQNETEQATIAA